ncbi:HDX [Branchiostoma lanceolatum]|uniref:HDX protein n=1 Tax=Branchiostoma lanceolatum TaxID=7740 RepID=A0A8J9YJS5_BRALA|nr:HDX [Branchiostoma lanceolatum]
MSLDLQTPWRLVEMPFQERQAFSNKQVETLKRYYEKGMNSQSLINREKMLACATETGLEFDTVRNWVGNYRRKLRLDAERKEQHEFYIQHGIPNSNCPNFNMSSHQLLANVAVETMKNIDPSIGSSTSLHAGPFDNHASQSSVRFPLPPVSSLVSAATSSQPAVTVLANPSGEMFPRHLTADSQEDQGLKIDSVFSMQDELMSQASAGSSSLLTEEMRNVLYSSPVNSQLLTKKREVNLSDQNGTAGTSSSTEETSQVHVVTVDTAVSATDQQDAPKANGADKSASSATDLLKEYEVADEQTKHLPRDQNPSSSSMVAMPTPLPAKGSLQFDSSATSSSPDASTVKKRKLSASSDGSTFEQTMRMGDIFQGPFERTVFTEEQVQVLMEHYEKGMNCQAKSCLDKMMAVAKELNLEFDVVRNWVGNQRRKRRMEANRANPGLLNRVGYPTMISGPNGGIYMTQNGGSLTHDDHSHLSFSSHEGSPEVPVTLHTSRDRGTYNSHDQPSSGYDLYMREFLEAQGLCREDLSVSLLREIDEGWQTLDDHQRQEYHRNALEIPSAAQDRDVNTVLQNIQQSLDGLKQDGCQYLLLTHREGDCMVTGTLAPMEYWNKVQHVESFKAFLDKRRSNEGNQPSSSHTSHTSSYSTEGQEDAESGQERRPSSTQGEETRCDEVSERSPEHCVDSGARETGTTREFSSVLQSDEEVYIVDKNHHIIGTGKLLPAPHKKIELSESSREHKGAI